MVNSICSDVVSIDNLSVDFFGPGCFPDRQPRATFTEEPAGGDRNNPGIVDDAAQMVSARIVLTNAQAGDVLTSATFPRGSTRPSTPQWPARSS